MKFISSLFCVNRTSDEVLEILESILNRTISDEEWDYFISVKIDDPDLEKIRFRVEEVWVHDSPYMIPGSINPTDLNPKGVTEIQKLIKVINNKKSGEKKKKKSR